MIYTAKLQLHLFYQKYSKTNIMKYYYNLNELFPI